MEVWRAATVPIGLEPVDGAEGDQRAGATDLGAFGEGSFGVWTITEGVSTDVEVDEVSVILSGRGSVEDLATGATVQLTPGTVLRLAAGTRTRWTIVEPIRKVYVVR
jgi:uncharacterized cupin superfamily protein